MKHVDDRERALPRAQRLVRPRIQRRLPSLRPREPLGRRRLGHPLRLHLLPRSHRPRQPRGPRLERQRRPLVGAHLPASTGCASTPSSTSRCAGSPTSAPAQPRVHRPHGRALLPRGRDLQLRRPRRSSGRRQPPDHARRAVRLPLASARLCEAVFTPAGGLDTLRDWASGNDSFYGATALMSTWVGNHDIPRAIHFASRQITDCRAGSSPPTVGRRTSDSPPTRAPYERLGVAFAVMLTSPGVPLMYYGDEVGPRRRRRPRQPPDDALGRRRAEPPPARASRAGASARAHPREQPGAGSRQPHHALQHAGHLGLSHGRLRHGARDVVVALNRADVARSVEVPAAMYEDLMRDGAPAEMGGRVELAPRSARVLRVR
jgi:hypothetical protein